MDDEFLVLYYAIICVGSLWFSISHLITKRSAGPYISALLWFMAASMHFGWFAEALERVVSHG